MYTLSGLKVTPLSTEKRNYDPQFDQTISLVYIKYKDLATHVPIVQSSKK